MSSESNPRHDDVGGDDRQNYRDNNDRGSSRGGRSDNASGMDGGPDGGSSGNDGYDHSDRGPQGQHQNQGYGQGDRQQHRDRFRGRRRRNGRGRQQRGQDRYDNPNAGPSSNSAVDASGNPVEAVPMEVTEGLLETMNEGYGFLRFSSHNYLPDENDIYVSANIIRRFQIRQGSMVKGEVAPPMKRGQKPALARVLEINGKDPEEHGKEAPFKNLVPCDPFERFLLETPVAPDISMRIVDLLTPIGRGQRALIVAPPRSGKTIIMQKIANAISTNHPEVKIIILLIDERPEEVTDMRRNTTAEVIASCLDEATANHVKVTELVLEKMRRQCEAGHHVVCLLDSITRLGRAYNNETKHSGRILSGGVDAKTLAKPKAFFGAARRIENGGSITIVATALVDTGSRMDQVIFEEFKGTGNMELVLSRQLANNRIFPAIDIPMSGTRKEEKLFAPGEHQKINVLRRVLNQLNPNEAMRLLIDRIEKSKSNAEFLAKFDVSGG